MSRFSLLAALLTLCAPAAAATADGLPAPASGHRPGPDALYQPPADAPQLDNAGPWKADPILVSGAQAYRGGEWLYQDFLYDDHGGAGSADPNNPWNANAHLFAPPAGSYTYPTDPVYAGNAADLVELRIQPLADATAFRVTFNSVKDASKSAFTIALGSSPAAVAWPHGAGVSSPAQLFLTVHGATAELLDAATGSAKVPVPTATVDMARRQFDVRVPHTAWDPGTQKLRVTIGTGLWDTVAGSYLAPAPGAATATTPGGAAPSQAAIVNVGPRFDEPMPDPTHPAPTYTLGDAAVGAAVQAAWWRESAQAAALRTGDISAFSATVDFAKLAAGTTDDSGVPRTGAMDRILASHHQFGQGLDSSKVCYDLAAQFSAGAKCIGRYVGQLQPYALYVPKKGQPADGWGMTLLLHSLSANYNQYESSHNQSELGDRGPGSLVITPSGRGPDGFDAGMAEADTFEVWADVARHYKLDPAWTVVSGYSMGGFSTYRLLARYPDLFARGFSVVGIPGTVDDQLASLRNTPIMAWNAQNDELVRVDQSEAAQQHLAATGLRFIEQLFPTADHLTLATNDEYGPGAAWLGTNRVDLDPAHVTYVIDPTEDSADAQTVADHAYWLSDLRVRDPKAAKNGTIDVRSEAFGTGDPKPTGVAQAPGTLDGGAHGPMPYLQRSQDWEKTPSTARADRLDVTATNVATATVDATRARVTCAPQLSIKSDGPLNLVVACPPLGAPAGSGDGNAGGQTTTSGSGKTKARRCARRFALRLPRVRGQRVVRVVARVGHHRVARARGRNVRRIVVRRTSRKAYTLRLTLTTSGHGHKKRRIVVKRRVRGC